MSGTRAAPRLQDRLEFINGAPDGEKDDFYLYHTTKDVGGKPPVEHKILGVSVILEKGHASKLFEKLHSDREKGRDEPGVDHPKISALTIICDELTINSELSLPRCNVTIHARRLLFGPAGKIDTSPLPWREKRAADASSAGGTAAKDGADGRKAGDITIFCGDVRHLDNGREGPLPDGFICLRAFGADGQDAGLGEDGRDGRSVHATTAETFTATAPWPFGDTKFNPKFDPPAYKIIANYYSAEVIPEGSQKWGTDDAPTNGTNALAPGKPGNGGDGGELLINRVELKNAWRNTAGSVGSKAKNVDGGRPGTPIKSGDYTLKLYYDLLGSKNGRVESKHTPVETKEGTPFKAQNASKGDGDAPKAQLADNANAWLHPELLRHMLLFVRDLYLADKRDRAKALLAAYDDALGTPCPVKLKAAPGGHIPGSVKPAWSEANEADWSAGQLQIATLRQRLEAGLDFFGNPAGYMPLMSLTGALRLYDFDAKTALSTLLLADWVQRRTNAKQDAGDALDSAIDLLNEASDKAAAQLTKARESVTSLKSEVETLLTQIETARAELNALSTELYNQASKDLAAKARTKFLLNTAAAVMQVIPYGQPVLGSLGDLTAVIADFDKDEPEKAIGKAGETIKDAVEAYKDGRKAGEKAVKTAVDDYKKARKEAGKPPKKRGEARAATAASKVSRLGTAADGLGPAVSHMAKAVSALSVSQAQIDAETKKLAAESPKWAKFAKTLEKLNDSKSTTFGKLLAAVQEIAEGYGQIAENEAAVAGMAIDQARDLAALNPASTQYIAAMGQRARMALTTSLYHLARSYETTVFTPIAVNWQMTKVYDHIKTLVDETAGKGIEKLLAQASVLEPIFQEAVVTVRRRLLKDAILEMKNIKQSLTIDDDHAHLLKALNEPKIKMVEIDPMERGVISPSRHRISVADVTLQQLEFDSATVPKSGNAEITLSIGEEGIVRVDERLYGVRRTNPWQWTWTKDFTSGDIEPERPSLQSLDLLNLVTDDKNDSVRQKLATPPAWAIWTLKMKFSDLPKQARDPVLRRLVLKIGTDYVPAPARQFVLDVRSDDPSATILCSQADMADCKDGTGGLYRIYAKNTDVVLEAKPSDPQWTFSRWLVDGDPRRGAKLSLTLDQHYEVRAEFLRNGEKIV